MSHYTITLGKLLRGFSDINEKPLLYASPHSIIERGRINFFKAIGPYPFRIWGDERDQAFQEEFEKNFLETFYTREIASQTPDDFYLKLGSFLRRKMPMMTIHWKKILEEMYVTQTGNVVGNISGNTTNDDTRTTGTKSRSDSHSDSKGTSDTKSETLSGQADTPQNELDMDVRNLKYASSVGKSDAVNHTETTGQSDTTTHSGDYTVSVGHATGNSITDSVTDNYGRSKDVFNIYDEWLKSGYDLFTPLYEAMVREDLFVIFN